MTQASIDPQQTRPGLIPWLAARWVPILAISLFLAGVALRWCWVMWWHDPRLFLYSDMGFYYNLGTKLADPGAILTPGDVTHPPAMPILTAWLIKNTWRYSLMPWLRPLQLAVSVAAPLAIAAFAWALFSRRTAWWALAVSSLYFPFIDYAGYLLAEIYVILLIPLVLTLYLCAMHIKRLPLAFMLGVLTGVVWSLGISFKLVLLPGMLCFGLVYLLFYDALQTFTRRALVTAAVIIGLLPGLVWMSERATRANEGRRCLVSNKNASDFLLGHYGRINGIQWQDPEGREYFRFGSPAAVQRGYSEVRTVPFKLTDKESNSYEAWNWIKANPGEALILSFQHVYDTFLGGPPWPSFATPYCNWAEAFQYIFVAIMLTPSIVFLVMTFLQRGLLKFLRGPEFLAFSPLIGLTASVFMATGEPRYRIPWDCLMIILAIEFFRRARDTARSNKPAPTSVK